MSSDDKLQIARLVTFGLAIIITALVWAYSDDLQELMVHKTTQYLGDSFNKMGGYANR